MKAINGSSERISKIIRVIDEIAFQTSILALNAAVEAARAGGAGMAFAAVAGEIRKLARRSAQAAKDTATRIEESIGRSQEDNRKLEQAEDSIHEFRGSASEVRSLADEVAVGSQEQSRGIEQIAAVQAQGLYDVVERVRLLSASGNAKLISPARIATAGPVHAIPVDGTTPSPAHAMVRSSPRELPHDGRDVS